MKMQGILAVAVALSAMPALAQDTISLVGTWTGHRERAAKVEGWRDGPVTLVITEQQSMTFVGELTRGNPDGDVAEGVWGAFTPGGRLIAGADEEGIYSFDLVDADTLDYCYAEAGEAPRTVCARLTRQP